MDEDRLITALLETEEALGREINSVLFEEKGDETADRRERLPPPERPDRVPTGPSPGTTEALLR
ncbi:MAG: hypothetical protein LLF90_04755 [Methanomicrobiaceae archaeon]|nr:hypothetical protein [Methanomicrobiaceae archaeon]